MSLLNDLDYNLYQLNITGEAKGCKSCESCRHYSGCGYIETPWDEPMEYEGECGIYSTIATLHDLFEEYTGEINNSLANYCPLYKQVSIGQEENDSCWDEPLSPDEIKTLDDLYCQAEEARYKEQGWIDENGEVTDAYCRESDFQYDCARERQTKRF